MKQSFSFYASLVGYFGTLCASILSAFFSEIAGFLFVLVIVGAVLVGVPFVKITFSPSKFQDFRRNTFPNSPRILQYLYFASIAFVVSTFFLQFFVPFAFGLWFWGLFMGVYANAAILNWQSPAVSF